MAQLIRTGEFYIGSCVQYATRATWATLTVCEGGVMRTRCTKLRHAHRQLYERKFSPSKMSNYAIFCYVLTQLESIRVQLTLGSCAKA